MLAGKELLFVDYGDVGKGTAASFRGAGSIVTVTRNQICALQAAMDGFEVKKLNTVVAMLISSSLQLEIKISFRKSLQQMKDKTIVCNIGHFDNEIAVAWLNTTMVLLK
jgi:adenosylhomocysteinase